MANDIRINIEVQKEREAARKLEHVGDAAEQAGESLEQMGEQATDAGKATEKAGEDFKKAGEDAGFLNRQITETRNNLTELIKKLDETGDTSLLKDIRRERRSLRQFENLAKDLAPDVAPAGAKAGAGFGQKFLTAASGAIASGNPYLIGAITNVAIAAAPLLGASVAAAVIGGTGTGGLIGGIALAAQDPRVQEAGTKLGEGVLRNFSQASSAFVQPLLTSLDKFGKAGAGWATKLGPSFDRLATTVEPLADGLIGLVDEALPGISTALDAARPIFEALSARLPDIGAAIGDMLNRLADDPQGAIDAINTLLGGLELGITISGHFFDALQNIYEAFTDVQEFLGFFDRTAVEVRLLARNTDEAAGSVKYFGESAEEAEARVRGLDAAIDQLINKELGLQGAQDELANGFAQLAEQIKRQREEGDKGAGSLEGNTQAARDNRTALTRLVDQYGVVQTESAKAGVVVEGLRKQFEQQAIKAGLAGDELREYLRLLDQIDAKRYGGIPGGGQGGAAFSQRASGGPVSAGKTYLVGEEGPELVTFGANGMVHDAATTRGMMSGTSGGSFAGAGAQEIRLIIDIRGDDEDQVRRIRKQVDVLGGGNVQVAFGRN